MVETLRIKMCPHDSRSRPSPLIGRALSVTLEFPKLLALESSQSAKSGDLYRDPNAKEGWYSIQHLPRSSLAFLATSCQGLSH